MKSDRSRGYNPAGPHLSGITFKIGKKTPQTAIDRAKFADCATGNPSYAPGITTEEIQARTAGYRVRPVHTSIYSPSFPYRNGAATVTKKQATPEAQPEVETEAPMLGPDPAPAVLDTTSMDVFSVTDASDTSDPRVAEASASMCPKCNRLGMGFRPLTGMIVCLTPGCIGSLKLSVNAQRVARGEKASRSSGPRAPRTADIDNGDGTWISGRTGNAVKLCPSCGRKRIPAKRNRCKPCAAADTQRHARNTVAA